MSGDLKELDDAEHRLMHALELVEQTVTSLSGGDAAQLNSLCTQFVEEVRESQTVLLRLAEQYAGSEALPYENCDYAARLAAQAAQREADAAEEALREQQARELGGGG